VEAEMTDFFNAAQQGSLSVKLWRGERMCLIGLDVTNPEPDFIGFSIEVKAPGDSDYVALKNRLNFSYDTGGKGVDGFRNFESTQAPFQKFRWLHFPDTPSSEPYLYRITKLHMPSDGQIVNGDQVSDLSMVLDKESYDGYLDVGFTRNFASSQAFNARCKAANPPIDPNTLIPSSADDGPSFSKLPGDMYEWLGFEAYELIFGILDEVVNDPSLSIDVFAYDFNEPDVIAKLVACGSRVRAVIDDSGSHLPTSSAESQVAAKLAASAGADHVVRMHFKTLQHNKVFIVKKDGTPIKVLFGSTNFSFRGLYIQANNALVFHSPDAAQLFSKAFDQAFTKKGRGFATDPISGQWQLVQPGGEPLAHFCFSPHSSSGLSLNPVGAAIDQASSSVFYAIAFLNQIKSGPTRDAINRLMTKDVFSYGIADKEGGLTINKPDGSVGQVDFAYLAAKVPEPFSSEWSGGSGIHLHDKFVVCDFNLPSAKVFTGSSNLSPSGETGNGDNLVMIEDQRVATAYAIEALRIFDHLEFRAKMQASESTPGPIMLAKPVALSGAAASWFAPFYVEGSQKARDRMLFSH
jgi:phosphatidylserine/phosphatidylglycerophosphate/cardiolipin synthase-like enzyme